MKFLEQYVITHTHHLIGGRAKVSWKNSEDQIAFLQSAPPVIGQIVTYDIPPEDVGGDGSDIFSPGMIDPPPNDVPIGGTISNDSGKG